MKFIVPFLFLLISCKPELDSKKSAQVFTTVSKQTDAQDSSGMKSDAQNTAPNIYLFSYSADGNHPVKFPPPSLNSKLPNIFARHLGPTFDKNTQTVSSDGIFAFTGLKDGKLFGSMLNNSSTINPTFVSYNQSGEVGLYIDTLNLHKNGYFPLSTAYCKSVGLGGPQLTLEQTQSLTPWSDKNKKFALAVDYQLAYALYISRNPQNTYVTSNHINLPNEAPIFQSSFFIYLKEDKVDAKTIGILFNFYDPRGMYERAIGNDNNTFFYTSPLNKKDVSNNDLTSEFTVEGSSFITTPSPGYKNVKVSISYDQLYNILKKFNSDQAIKLLEDPAKYKLVSIGLLNEITPLFQSSECISTFDIKTSATVGLSFKNFKFNVVNNNTLVQFYLDEVNSKGQAIGWAYDPDAKNKAVTMAYFIDGVLIESKLNADYRADVNAAFGLTGNHGFFWQIPSRFRDGKNHELRIEAQDINAPEENNVIVSKSNFLLPAIVQINAVVKTYMDSLNKNGNAAAIGWAYDPDTKNKAVTMAYFIDGVLIESKPNADYRADVNAAFGLTGNHGFFWQVPSRFRDGKNHELRIEALDINAPSAGNVIVSKSNFLLPAIVQINAVVKTYMDSLNKNGNAAAIGWAYDPDAKNKAVTIAYFIDGVLIESKPNADYRADVNAAFGLTGNHGFYWQIPSRFRDGKTHELRIEALDINAPSAGNVIVSKSNFLL